MKTVMTTKSSRIAMKFQWQPFVIKLAVKQSTLSQIEIIWMWHQTTRTVHLLETDDSTLKKMQLQEEPHLVTDLIFILRRTTL